MASDTQQQQQQQQQQMNLSLGRVVEPLVSQMETMLRRRQITGSATCAKKTAEVMRMVLSKEQRNSVAATIALIRLVGRRLNSSSNVEFAIGNIVRRVLYIVREEAQQLSNKMHSKCNLADEDDYYHGQRSRFRASSSSNDPHMSDGSGSSVGSINGGSENGNDVPRMRTVSLHMLIETGGSLSHSTSYDELNAITEEDESTGSANDYNNGNNSNSQGMSRGNQGKPVTSGSRINKESRDFMKKLRHNVIDCINELIDEIDTIEGLIAEQAIEHIHANEVILTSGNSRSVFEFLREAAKKRVFQVVVAESMPQLEGHTLARKLLELGVQTTVIPDAAVFAMMARVNMVLNGAHAVLANGGVVTRAGVHTIAQAAAYHSVPFLVLTGLYKLSPLYPHDQATTINEYQSPANLLEYRELEECLYTQMIVKDDDDDNDDPSLSLSGQEDVEKIAKPDSSSVQEEKSMENDRKSRAQKIRNQARRRLNMSHLLEVSNYAFDYVPPHLINLFVTDIGGHAPSYIYRLLTEYYNAADQIL